MKNIITTIFLALALFLALACGGGGSNSTSANQATLRLKGGNSTDTVKITTLNDVQVGGNVHFDSTGTASVHVDIDFSLRVEVMISSANVKLFETLVSKSDLSAGGTINVVINSATTILAQNVSPSDLTAIYDKEKADYDAKVAASQTITAGALPVGADNILAVLSPKNWNVVYTSYNSASPIATGDTKLFTFSSSGTLLIDNVVVAANPTVSSAGYELTWDTSSLRYSASLTGQPTDAASTRTLNEVNVNSISSLQPPYGIFYGQYREVVVLAKSRSVASTYTDLKSLLSSYYGVSTLSNLNLTSSTVTSLSTTLFDAIRRHALLSAIALRSADDGFLSQTGWANVLAAADATANATDPNTAAANLASAITSNLQTTTPVTKDKFSAALSAFLSSWSNLETLLSNLQSGNASGALMFIKNSSSNYVDPTIVAYQALVDNNVLSAAEYFKTAAAESTASDNTYLMAALTRVISMGIDNNNSALKAFQKAANLDYTFTNNAKLDDLFSDVELSLQTKTNYDSPMHLTGFASASDIVDYLTNGFLPEVEQSIVYLENILDFNKLNVIIPVTQQGKDLAGSNLGSSPIYLDGVDAKALLAFLYSAKAKANFYLGHDFEADNVNETQAHTLQRLYDLSDAWMLTGNVKLPALTWTSESGTITTDSLFTSGMNINGHFPGMLLLDGVKDIHGHLITFDIEVWDVNRHAEQLLIADHPAVHSGKAYDFYFKSDFKASNGRNYHFEGGFIDGSAWDFTIKVSEGSNFGVFHAQYIPNGSFSHQLRDTKDSELAAAINGDSGFLTTKSSVSLSAARTALNIASEYGKEVLDALKVLSAGTRLNHLVETPDFQFKNKTVMSTTQINGVKTFVGGLVNAMYNSSYVNPTVFDSTLTPSYIDLTAVFNTPLRSLVTENNTAIMVSGNIKGNETFADNVVDGSVTNKTVFGISSALFSDHKTASAYTKFKDIVDDWVQDGVLTKNFIPVVPPTNQFNKTKYTGSAIYSQVDQVVGVSTAVTSTLTINVDSNGDLIVAGSDIVKSYSQGLLLFLESTSTSPVEHIFTTIVFSDNTFTKAVGFSVAQKNDLGTLSVNKDVFKLTKSSGSISASANFGMTAFTGSMNATNNWESSSTVETGSATWSASYNSSKESMDITYLEGGISTEVNAYLHGRVYAFSTIDAISGNCTIFLGKFNGDGLSYTAVSAGISFETGSSAWMDFNFGNVTSTATSSFSGLNSYAGSLTSTSIWQNHTTSVEVTDAGGIAFTPTSNSFAGLTQAPTAETQLIGPIAISSLPVTSLGRSFDVRYFSSDFESYLGIGIGTDTVDVNVPKASWIDYHHGTATSNTLQVNIAN